MHFAAPFAVLYFAHSKILKHKLMVVASKKNILDLISILFAKPCLLS